MIHEWKSSGVALELTLYLMCIIYITLQNFKILFLILTTISNCIKVLKKESERLILSSFLITSQLFINIYSIFFLLKPGFEYKITFLNLFSVAVNSQRLFCIKKGGVKCSY